MIPAASQTGHIKPIPGILAVNSDVIHTDKLSRKDFDIWYADDHIHDVVGKSGVTAAYRYDYRDDGSTPKRQLGYYTIYHMPDINFLYTDEFTALEGQSPGPNKDKIFVHAEFHTATYELVKLDEKPGQEGSGPAPCLIYATLAHKDDSALEKFYLEEHISEISKCPGYRRMALYKNHYHATLKEFIRSEPPVPKWLALHEFDGPEIPWKQLQATDATDWANKIVPDITEMDFGLFELKRVYGKDPSKNGRNVKFGGE